MDFFRDAHEWITPVALAGGGILVGFVSEKVVLGVLRKVAWRTNWGWDAVVIGALRHMTILWFALAGIYGAILSVPVGERIAHALSAAILTVVIFTVTLCAARIAVGFVDLYSSRREGALPQTTIIANIVRTVVMLIGLLVILQSLGISITPILTALGVGGLAVALALQDTLSNLFAGLQILASGQFSRGDYVLLENGAKGHVTDITWRNTSIRTLEGNMVIVPNAKLASAIITNYHLPSKELVFAVKAGVAYGSALETAERVAIEVARAVQGSVEGADPGFEPYVRFTGFGESSVDFKVFLCAREFPAQYLLTHEFIKRLHTRFAREGIEIPFPVRAVHMK
ncbi:MAG: mechanosensitive ion channel family protein [Spirochaetes bacterium]|nr:MAG: mechanosensitive ion channel family protein [Spirochaetota bacterium]